MGCMWMHVTCMRHCSPDAAFWPPRQCRLVLRVGKAPVCSQGPWKLGCPVGASTLGCLCLSISAPHPELEDCGCRGSAGSLCWRVLCLWSVLTFTLLLGAGKWAWPSGSWHGKAGRPVSTHALGDLPKVWRSGSRSCRSWIPPLASFPSESSTVCPPPRQKL